MTHKLDDDAFAYYVALGAERSYQLVARYYGVSKRAIVKAARRENWVGRLEKIERDARERTDRKLGEGIEENRLRHLKLLRAMGSRAAKAIQEYPLTSGMDGIRAAELVIKLERLLDGESTQRTEMTVEQVTRAEVDKLLVHRDEPEEVGEEDEDGDADW